MAGGAGLGSNESNQAAPAVGGRHRKAPLSQRTVRSTPYRTQIGRPGERLCGSRVPAAGEAVKPRYAL
eukprot:7382164-Prymnesium_polylepis.1